MSCIPSDLLIAINRLTISFIFVVIKPQYYAQPTPCSMVSWLKLFVEMIMGINYLQELNSQTKSKALRCMRWWLIMYNKRGIIQKLIISVPLTFAPMIRVLKKCRQVPNPYCPTTAILLAIAWLSKVLITYYPFRSMTSVGVKYCRKFPTKNNSLSIPIVSHQQFI